MQVTLNRLSRLDLYSYTFICVKITRKIDNDFEREWREDMEGVGGRKGKGKMM